VRYLHTKGHDGNSYRTAPRHTAPLSSTMLETGAAPPFSNLSTYPINQSGREDLNFRPPAPEAGALPSCATPRAYTYLQKPTGCIVQQVTSRCNTKFFCTLPLQPTCRSASRLFVPMQRYPLAYVLSRSRNRWRVCNHRDPTWAPLRWLPIMSLRSVCPAWESLACDYELRPSRGSAMANSPTSPGPTRVSNASHLL
jgi:hypothetical protein